MINLDKIYATIGNIKALKENYLSVHKLSLMANIYIEDYFKDEADKIIFRVSGEIYNKDILGYDEFTNRILNDESLNMSNKGKNEIINGFAYFYDDLLLSFEEFLSQIKIILGNDINHSAFINLNELFMNKESVNSYLDSDITTFLEKWNQLYSNILFKIKFYNKKNIRTNNVNVTFAFDDILNSNIYMEFVSVTNNRKIIIDRYKQKSNPISNTRITNFFSENYSNHRATFDEILANHEILVDPNNNKNLKEKIIINNVGQANFVEVNTNEVSFAFDIGLNKKSSTKLNEKIKNYIREKSYNFIIISHLHWDHISAITYLTDNQFNCDWYISNMGDKKDYVIRYLDKIKLNCRNLKLYDKGGLLEDIKVINGKLYQGICCEPQYKVMNNAGLILSFKRWNKNYLLTGDCGYDYIPNEAIKKGINVLIAPHHGAKQDNISDYLKVTPADNKALAIISVGKNGYGHPTVEHIYNLTKRGFSIYSTQDNGNIKISLLDNKIETER